MAITRLVAHAGRTLKKLVRPASWLVNLVLPPECSWCLEPVDDGQSLCEGCAAVFRAGGSCCQKCAMPIPAVVDRSACFRCRDQGWRFERVLALGPYRGRLREAVILMKKPAFEALAASAGRMLGERVLAQVGDSSALPDLVLPVPNHWTRRLTNRTSAAESMAAALAQTLARPMRISLLGRTRRTKKQGMLAWSQRSENVQQAFRVRKPSRLVGRSVMLVDDVFTSGATAAELTRCLLRAGAKSVTVAVAARGTGSRDVESNDKQSVVTQPPHSS